MGLLSRISKKESAVYADVGENDIEALRKRENPPEVFPHASISKDEHAALQNEIMASKKAATARKKNTTSFADDFLPSRVDKFDDLVQAGGFERGSAILMSGGAGTGKTTFCLQSIYYGALKGEKGIYISLEEEPENLKKHMLRNFGWDFYALEKKGLVALMKYDALEIARNVEAIIMSSREKLSINLADEFSLPFNPDRVAFDSLTALSNAFGSTESYRRYIRYLFEKFEKYNSVNFFISETQQDPKVYSMAGIGEFLADGVIVLYNIQSGSTREQALEILKLRSSGHLKQIVPYEITSSGIKIFPYQEIFGTNR